MCVLIVWLVLILVISSYPCSLSAVFLPSSSSTLSSLDTFLLPFGGQAFQQDVAVTITTPAGYLVSGWVLLVLGLGRLLVVLVATLIVVCKPSD